MFMNFQQTDSEIWQLLSDARATNSMIRESTNILLGPGLTFFGM